MSESVNPPGAGAPPSADPGVAPPKGRFSTPILVGLMAGAIFLIAFTVAILRRGDHPILPVLDLGSPRIPALGRGGEGAPSILAPIRTIPRGRIILHWVPVPALQEYEALIYNNSIRLLWRSGRIRGDNVEVPPATILDMVPGTTHFWKVVGYGANGEEEASPTVPITIAP